ncbi:hypothetical protein [Nonomuraea sp. NPDC005692]|uniref:ABC transporter permease n=1 Tax=Nonomuraea sp. NPDC005692 TaxID=3157168 RepID=UPI00340BF6C2
MSSAPEQESLAALATRHGLRRATARPDMHVYLRRLWERRHFILVYATSRTASKYSASALGQLWQVVTPLLNAGIYWVMFGLVLGGQEHIENYAAFLVTGMFVFTYSQRSASAGARSVSGNLSLIRALHFPRAALPWPTPFRNCGSRPSPWACCSSSWSSWGSSPPGSGC